MDSSQELQHWGIKGQKWGIRRYQNDDGTLTEAGKRRYRYQNPDGSLTDEGKAHYMEAARKGKLNPKKLSDEDLNMINQRFEREKKYEKNVKEYEESKFSYKLKKAVIDRVKGNSGGGGGGGKNKGGSGIGNLLAMPIKKAFEEAFKNPDKGDGGGGGGSGNNDSEKIRRVDAFIQGSAGKKSIANFASDDRINTGKRFMGVSATRDSNSDYAFKEWKSDRNTSAADVLRSRNGYTTDRQKNDWKNTSNKRKKKMKAKHSDFEEVYLAHVDTLVPFIIQRSEDYLAHHGIKGQKWGVRRYQNTDGTWTDEGKLRYGKGNSMQKYLYDTQQKFLKEGRMLQEEARKGLNENMKNRSDYKKWRAESDKYEDMEAKGGAAKKRCDIA